MARLNNGILGGFSGTIGPVVGAKWKGVNYIRSRPKKSRKKKGSPAQEAARAKFTFLNAWLKHSTEFLAIGFKNYSGKMTGMMAAYSCNYKAVTDEYPNFRLDFKSVLVSYGDLPGAKEATLILSESAMLEITWVPNLQERKARSDDQVMLLAYSQEQNESIYITSGAMRDKGSQKLKVSESFSGTSVETFIAFISNDRTRISESQYLGQVIVL